MNVKVIAALGLILALGVAMFFALPEGTKPIGAGDAVKPFQLPDLNGKVQGLPEGKVYLLNFWATWCPPCRKEVPSMVKLYETFKDKGFEIVAVSVDQGDEVVKNFVAENKMNFTVLWDKDSSISKQYNVFRYPETFIVGRDGKILQHLKGGVEWLQPEFYNYIQSLVSAPIQK